jgi:hypothetical protein
MGEEAIQHALHGANVGLTPALVGERDAVGWREMLVQQQPLHDPCEICHVTRPARGTAAHAGLGDVIAAGRV